MAVRKKVANWETPCVKELMVALGTESSLRPTASKNEALSLTTIGVRKEKYRDSAKLRLLIHRNKDNTVNVYCIRPLSLW